MTSHLLDQGAARLNTFKGVVYITRCPRARVAAEAASRLQYGRREGGHG